ncbi:MAG TPA: energy transducer TonB [Steroidobacteraceae bacterium]|nr:energy transducer TonB [Steroidobacteraceae bacterium]
MSMVAGLHVAALYLIASSLGIVPPLVPDKVVDTRLVDETPPPEDTPPIPQPRNLEPPTLVAQTPEVLPDDAFQLDSLIVEFRDDPPVVPPVQPPVHEAQLMGVRMDSRYPLTQPNYPLTDIRQGNEGTAEIEVYVLPSGRIGDARIVKSAGSPTLDQSAIEEAKRRWRLLPATRDGEPYAQWHRLKVTFNLRNR